MTSRSEARSALRDAAGDLDPAAFPPLDLSSSFVELAVETIRTPYAQTPLFTPVPKGKRRPRLFRWLANRLYAHLSWDIATFGIGPSRPLRTERRISWRPSPSRVSLIVRSEAARAMCGEIPPVMKLVGPGSRARVLAWRWMPLPLILAGRRVAFGVTDLVRRTTAEDGLPPRWLRFVGTGDFVVTGQRFVDYLERWAGLHPESRVLDIGCGVGRMAIPLEQRLSPRGAYVGFDTVRPAIVWCGNHIAERSPNFRFVHVNVFNGMYNRRGRQSASQVRFPVEDGWADVALAASVFTHMPPNDVQHYLKEVGRALAQEGRLLATFNLIDDVVRDRMQSGGGSGERRVPVNGYWAKDPRLPELVAGHELEWVLTAAGGSGLRAERVLWGSWSGRADAEVDGQDIVVFCRD